MAVLEQILHMGKDHFYVKNLQRLRVDIPVLEPT